MDKRNVDESFRLMYNTPWTKEMLMNRLHHRLMYNTAMDKRNVDESFRLMYNTPWTKEMLMNPLD